MDLNIVKKTQELLGPFITNPVLAEKFLLKPPIRFLHDVFIAIASHHQLMGGLFDEDEIHWKDSVATDKDAKLFFITKIRPNLRGTMRLPILYKHKQIDPSKDQSVINFVSLATNGQGLDIQAARVCAGQDPEKTNQLLQTLAQLLSQENVDNSAVIGQVRDGKGPIDLKQFSKSTAFMQQKTSPKSAASENLKVIPPPTTAPIAIEKKPMVPQATAKVEKTKRVSDVKPGAKTKPLKAVQSKDTTQLAPVASSRKVVESSPTHTTNKPLKHQEPAPPVTVRPPSARPVTGRAPQRPPTASIRSRSDTYDRQEQIEPEDQQDIPPPNVSFLTDENRNDKDEIEELLRNVEESQDADRIQLRDDKTGNYIKEDAGQLVANLEESRNAFKEQNADVDQAEYAVNPYAQQEVMKFTNEVEVLRNALQKVSRLSDVLTTFMELLPEDFEEMEKDRLRYGEELHTLQAQIEEASKMEQKELEKLKRKLVLNEEMLFTVTEEIASTQYRIREKADILRRLQAL